VAFNPPIADNDIPSSAKWNTAGAAYDRSTSTVDVTSTTTLTSIYSKAIDAGHLSSDRTAHLVVRGDILNSTGSNRGWQMKVLFGATTLYDGTNASLMVSNAQRVPFILELWLSNKASASVQECQGRLTFGKNDEAAPTTGIGPMVALGFQGFPFGGTAAEDTASAKTLDIQVAPSANSASLSIRKKSALLELW
jgi:hypothetical protein